MPVFEEVKYLKQVSVLPQQNSVNVQWAVAVKKDGNVISETYERKAYTADQKAEFAAEVEGADSYLAVLGW